MKYPVGFFPLWMWNLDNQNSNRINLKNSFGLIILISFTDGAKGTFLRVSFVRFKLFVQCHILFTRLAYQSWGKFVKLLANFESLKNSLFIFIYGLL